jgi:hypothetical protein
MKRKSEHICECDWCVETRSLATEFDTYIASTPLQKRMKSVIESIQAKYGDDDGDEDDIVVFSSRK